ncbi:MAG: DUF4091 domain-containing protein [Candidatus Hydrogenedentes bacterium]|nr:DUF4091 domain-containing protein [Candidatus Hydrogenedentota bacterium]
MSFGLILMLWTLGLGQPAGAVTEDIEVRGNYLDVLIDAGEGAPVESFMFSGTDRDQAGPDGLLQEGFGVSSFYVPNRRLNGRLEVLVNIDNRPLAQYAYDGDGPNITGIRATRLMEPMLNESSLKVDWTLEHKGTEDQWVAPWVRQDITPGGAMDDADRVDLPTVDGVRRIAYDAYYQASRNWFAVTDTALRETVYGVFNSDHVHSFLVQQDEKKKSFVVQTAFVPRIMAPGAKWETKYRINAVRGLTHVNFATSELAAQLDYKAGELVLLIAGAKPLPDTRIAARILGPEGDVFDLPAKRFTATPDAVIRCTYPWKAPEDGAYEFLAQLTHNGKPFDLGADMAPPHGGIDAQFTVGEGAAAPFEAWTDAPYALEHGGRELRRNLAARGDVAMWFDSPMEKIFPKDVAVSTGTYQAEHTIRLARNESESFQFIVRPPKDRTLRNLTVRLGGFEHETGVRIQQSNVSAHRATYYRVKVPSNFEGPTGYWPDALPPVETFTAPGGQCSPLWFTVTAPANAQPGIYTGKLQLMSPDLDPMEFTIKVEVYDFELPRTPALKTDFGFEPQLAYDWCKQFGYTGTLERCESEYLGHALQHRVTLRQGAQLPAESANYAASLAGFERRLTDLKQRGISTVAVPPSLLDVPEQLTLANEFVIRHGLRDMAFCPIADTPPKPAWPRLVENMQRWQELAPDIPLVVTTQGLEAFLPDQLTIWSVHLPMMDTVNNRPVLERVSQGGEVWTWLNYSPPRPYANFLIDFNGIEHRTLFWQIWTLGMKGFSYWSINHTAPGQNPWEDLLDVTPVNGDGFLVYPSANGPVSSIRWELIRDGLEDFDYLVLLRERIVELERSAKGSDLLKRAQAVLNLEKLVPNLVTLSRDSALLESKRDEIARMIVELNNVLPKKP